MAHEKNPFKTVDLSDLYNESESVQPQSFLEKNALRILGDEPNRTVTVMFDSLPGESYYSNIRVDARRTGEAPLTSAHILAAAYDKNKNLLIQAQGLCRHIAADNSLAQLTSRSRNTPEEFVNLDQVFDIDFPAQNDIPPENQKKKSELFEMRVKNLRLAYGRLSSMVGELIENTSDEVVLLDDIDAPDNKFCFTQAKGEDNKRIIWVHYIVKAVGAPVIAAMSVYFMRNILDIDETEYQRNTVLYSDSLFITGGTDEIGYSVPSLYKTLGVTLEKDVEELSWEESDPNSPLSIQEN